MSHVDAVSRKDKEKPQVAYKQLFEELHSAIWQAECEGHSLRSISGKLPYQHDNARHQSIDNVVEAYVHRIMAATSQKIDCSATLEATRAQLCAEIAEYKGQLDNQSIENKISPKTNDFATELCDAIDERVAAVLGEHDLAIGNRSARLQRFLERSTESCSRY